MKTFYRTFALSILFTAISFPTQTLAVDVALGTTVTNDSFLNLGVNRGM